jgi:holo-[acyl-carrier protein] synthase
MSIVGLGVDLVELRRIESILERHGERFLSRICRPGEVGDRSGSALVPRVGGLFAAKEAALKALGTGWAQGLAFRDVEVARAPSGTPSLRFYGAAAARRDALGVTASHLSISHEREHAVAVVVLVAG